MAEFRDVMKEFKRMCQRDTRDTQDCPMFCGPSCNIGHCRWIAFERPDEFERVVMDWAKRHPEPVYPTWKEYFAKLYGGGLFGEPLVAIGKLCEESIPADIARRLGVEPKEGWHD